MATRIQLKRLTSTDIDQCAVILAAGEPCLAKDTSGKEYIVFGDGTTALKDLKREPIGDAASVAIDKVTIDENASNELEVQLSADANNAMTVKIDGLFVETVDQVKVSTKNLLPTTGAEKTLYVVSDEKHIYYWDGTAYVQLTQDFAGLIYKGSKPTTADLPTTGMKNGDFWWIVDEDKFKIWNGTTWDTIELAQDQADMAETTTTSTTFIKNKKAEYITFVPLTGGVLTKTNVQEALEEVDAALKDKQDKVPTATEDNYASWDNAGQTKDSGDSKTTTVAPLDSASDNKLPSEKAVAKVKKDLEDILNQQPTANSGDQGDKAILPLITDATVPFTIVGMKDNNYTAMTDNMPGGYILTGCQSAYLNRMFNRIKLMIATPGWVRIGIVRGTGTNEYDHVARGFCKADPRYDTTDTYPTTLAGADDTTADGQPHTLLRKWLVCQWVSTTGLHEFDIPDEIITSPFEYVYAETRCGVAGWAYNRTSTAQTQAGLSIPANTVATGIAAPTTFISTTNFNNGSYAVSSNMLDASARPTYVNSNGAPGVLYSSFNSLSSGNASNLAVNRGANSSWLNIGLYQRGSAGNTYLNPVIENCISGSSHSEAVNNCIKGYGPVYEDQQILAEKGSEIYGIELMVKNPGDLTFYVFSSNDPATARIVKCFTLRIRAIGKQLIHLPEPVVLQPGQWCGVNGATEALVKNMPIASVAGATTLNKGYTDTAHFLFNAPAISNFTAKGDDPTGVQDIIPYSSASGTVSCGISHWTNVKYIPGAEAGTGKIDFTGATFATDTGTGYERNYLNVALVVRGGTRSKLEDYNYSVTGDSITTYAGQISQTTDFGVKTNAAGNNAVFYPNAGSGFTNSIDGTWWGILGKQCRMRLVKNDAWSGSQVGGTESTTNSTACASSIRCSMLSNKSSMPLTPNTSTGLATPTGTPNIIFCMIGTNDLAGNRAAGAWSNTAPTDISTIIGAFETMVARHKVNYPLTKLVYFLIPRGTQVPYPYTNANGLSIAQLAQEMEYTAKNMGAYFVPLDYFHRLSDNGVESTLLWTPTNGYMGPRAGREGGDYATDHLHPTTLGHQIIADALQRFCEEKF